MNEFSFKGLVFEWLELKKMSVKYSTYLKYESVVENQINPYFGNMGLNDFNDTTIIAFFNQKREYLSNSYLKIIKYVLNSIIQLGKEKYNFSVIHMDMIKFSKSNQTSHILTPIEKNKLLDYCKDHHDQLSVSILISLYGGLRIGEICALKWKNIDFNDHIIHVTHTAQRQKIRNSFKKTHVVLTAPKTKTSLRYVPVPEFLIMYLRKYKTTNNDNDFVLSNTDFIYEPRRVQKSFKNLCLENEIETNFHNLRHTYATECVQENVEIKSLSEILGHSKVSTTLDLYVHSNMEYKKKQIEKIPIPSWA